MFTKILCPTDFSDPARAAVQMAHHLALQNKAKLVLMHAVDRLPVMPPPTVGTASPAFDVPRYQSALRDSASRQLDELAAGLESVDVALETHVVEGPPADEILEYAEQEDFDLIVIATHGRTGVRRFLFGSVAEKVVRSAPCPVLTIRQREN
jgi:nucleotide-binding universal stress UspA family protein